MPGSKTPKKSMSFAERKAYTEGYRKARKTKEGSPKALFGGDVAHKAGKKAAKSASSQKKTTKR